MVKNNKNNKTLKFIFVAFIMGIIFSIFYEVDIKRKPTNLSFFIQPTPAPIKSTTAPAANSPEAQQLADEVIPSAGYTVNISWGDIGKKLVASGAIDLAKYKKNYTGEQYEELISYLAENKSEGITVNRENAYFWVNTLWAMGLVQKSDVLEKGVMGTQYKDQVGSFASTGGWTLGSKDAVSLYSSANIVSLTPAQQQLVDNVANGIYRPCCGNSAAFPDCNHGMAILGLLEIMASQGATEEEMYEASLAFNSYWFTQTYMDIAYYFQTKEGLSWDQVDPKVALSQEFSSASGYQNIKKQVGNTPSLQGSGGSCGA